MGCTESTVESNARYWTAGELQQMIEASQFNVLSVNHDPPIVIVTERPIEVHKAA
ncbi:MAG: hypothetical protein U9R25_08445 [Chloroflexota bacterium]|nr:hypothetical protein [Chloroflexota bacterium]